MSSDETFIYVPMKKIQKKTLEERLEQMSITNKDEKSRIPKITNEAGIGIKTCSKNETSIETTKNLANPIKMPITPILRSRLFVGKKEDNSKKVIAKEKVASTTLKNTHNSLKEELAKRRVLIHPRKLFSNGNDKLEENSSILKVRSKQSLEKQVMKDIENRTKKLELVESKKASFVKNEKFILPMPHKFQQSHLASPVNEEEISDVDMEEILNNVKLSMQK